MTWINTDQGLVSLKQAHLLMVQQPANSWVIQIFIDANVFVSADSTEREISYGAFSSEDDAIAVVIQWLQGQNWVQGVNGFFINLDKVYEIAVDAGSPGNDSYVLAYFNSGVASNSGNDQAAPAIAEYSTSSAANAGLSKLLEQLSIPNIG